MSYKLQMVAHVFGGRGNSTVNAESVRFVSRNPKFKLGCTRELRLAASDVAIVSISGPA